MEFWNLAPRIFRIFNGRISRILEKVVKKNTYLIYISFILVIAIYSYGMRTALRTGSNFNQKIPELLVSVNVTFHFKISKCKISDGLVLSSRQINSTFPLQIRPHTCTLHIHMYVHQPRSRPYFLFRGTVHFFQPGGASIRRAVGKTSLAILVFARKVQVSRIKCVCSREITSS